MSNFCPSCGVQHDPTAHFCEQCGTPFDAAAQQTQPITPPPTAAPPGTPVAPAGTPAPQSSGNGLTVLVVAALVVGVIALGVGAFVLLRSSGTGGTTTAATSPSVSPSPTPTVTLTKKPKPAPTVTVTRQSIPDLPDWPGYTIPTEYKSCDVGVYASPATSCPFANNVASAWYSSGGSTFLSGVYSPVTDQYYDMYCSETLPTECTGGNNASVVIDYIP